MIAPVVPLTVTSRRVTPAAVWQRVVDAFTPDRRPAGASPHPGQDIGVLLDMLFNLRGRGTGLVGAGFISDTMPPCAAS